MPTDTNEILQQQLAQELRGIALPDAVSWWPLAIGWWVLIAVSLIVVTAVIIKLRKRIIQNRYRKIAVSELRQSYNHWQQDSNTSSYLQSTNALLKRVVNMLEQEQSTHNISKSGSDWGELLNKYNKQPFSESAISALTVECYQANPDVDVPELQSQVEDWLNSHRRPAHA